MSPNLNKLDEQRGRITMRDSEGLGMKPWKLYTILLYFVNGRWRICNMRIKE